MKKITIGYLIIALILIFPLILGAGCELIPEVDITLPSPPPPEPEVTTNTTPINTEGEIPTSPIQAPPLPSIADAVAKVKPSVVAITTEFTTYDFFNRPTPGEGAGSGWIVREDGIIITNSHVVTGAESIIITLDDGRTFPAQAVRTDPLTDLAVVKIDAQNLPAADVGNSSQLRIGDWVVAIGNSLGLGTRATSGIVSAVEVRVEVSAGQTLYNLIQTDAAINPGNSGGPLVNMSGEVIGITSAKLAAVEGVGYAISSNEAIPIIEQLINPGYVTRPWLGVVLYTVDEFAVLKYNLEAEEGSLIVHMVPDSPADKAGLKDYDVIVSMGGKEITNTEEMIRAIHASEIGEKVEIVFWRGPDKHTTYATLIEKPRN